MDFSLLTINCLQIPLGKLLKKGFSTGHGYLRSPATIQSASALTCIAIQSSQNDMYGGQSVPLFDYDLAPYVAKSYLRNCAEFAAVYSGIDEDYLKKNFVQVAEKKFDLNHLHDHVSEVAEFLNEVVKKSFTEEDAPIVQIPLDRMISFADKKTIKDAHQAMESLVHNLCTMQCLPSWERIWVWDTARDQYVLITMKELYDNFQSDRYLAVSYDVHTQKARLNRILNAWCSPNTKKMVKVSTADGSSLTTTLDHRYLTIDGSYTPAEAVVSPVTAIGFGYKSGEKLHTPAVDADTLIQLYDAFIEILHRVVIEHHYYDDGIVNCTTLFQSLSANTKYLELIKSCYQLTSDLNEPAKDPELVNVVLDVIGKADSQLHLPRFTPEVYRAVTSDNIDTITKNVLKVIEIRDNISTESVLLADIKFYLLSVYYPEQSKSNLLMTDSSHTTIEFANDEDTVYDIEVENDNNFMTACGWIVHNSRAGSQTPFSSVNFGTCTSWEGRAVSDALLDACDAGLGNGETAIFPITIFKMKKSVNGPGAVNHDLFQKSCRVSAKRMLPNWVNLDAPYNAAYYKEGDPRTEVATMGALAWGQVSISLENGDAFLGDIKDVGQFLMDHPEVIDGEARYLTFDKHTRYLNLKPGKIRIEDSQTGSPQLVDVKRFMIWDDPNANWLAIDYEFEGWYRAQGQVVVTDDHPLRVLRDGVWQRVLAYELEVGDVLCPAIPGTSPAKIVSINPVNNTEIITGYDFETASDTFNVNHIVSHNCRTRVISNVYDPDNAICYGRGNLFWSTINLPYLALEAKEECRRDQNLFKLFMKKVDDVFDALVDYSDDRLAIISKRKAKNYPFMMGQHEYVGSEILEPEDTIGEVIKNGTISFGFIGLAETLLVLTGHHHGESEASQKVGLEIIGHLRARCDALSKERTMNYSLMGTPAEGCTGRLCRAIKDRWGVIKGITDKSYIVNSSHLPPTFKVSAFDKTRIEAPYHELENAGHILYIQLTAEAAQNEEGFEELVQFMADSNCGYFAINHPVNRDPVCGYVGPLNPDGTCPRCGRKSGEGIAVSKLLSLTSYSPDPEYAVTAESLEKEDAVPQSLS